MLRKQVSRLSRPIPQFNFHAAWRSSVTLCLCLTSISAFAQAQTLASIQHRDQALLQMSEATLVEPFTTESNAVLRVERLGELHRFIASKDGKVTRSQWLRGKPSDPHVVYKSADHTFDELDNRVVATLKNPTALKALAQSTKAIRAKHSPGLGYSVFWLRPGDDPIQVVKQLRADEQVERAEVQFKRPLMIPL